MPDLKVRSLNSAEIEDFERLLSLEAEDLLSEWGQHVGTLAPGDSPLDTARRWLESRREELKQLICIEYRYCDFLKSKKAKTLERLAAVADVLVGYYGGLPINSLATILVRDDLLKTWCQCE